MRGTGGIRERCRGRGAHLIGDRTSSGSGWNFLQDTGQNIGDLLFGEAFGSGARELLDAGAEFPGGSDREITRADIVVGPSLGIGLGRGLRCLSGRTLVIA
jgi:hypothetical protein